MINILDTMINELLKLRLLVERAVDEMVLLLLPAMYGLRTRVL